MDLLNKILLLINCGFNKDSIKVKLMTIYNQRLIEVGQKPLSELNKYDFYRGIEYACDYLIDPESNEILNKYWGCKKHMTSGNTDGGCQKCAEDKFKAEGYDSEDVL